MSRSYKHTPGFLDHSPHNMEKIYARRKVRRMLKNNEEIADGMAYKKAYDPWNICDYKFLKFTRKDLVEWNDRNSPGSLPSYKDLMKINRENHKGQIK